MKKLLSALLIVLVSVLSLSLSFVKADDKLNNGMTFELSENTGSTQTDVKFTLPQNYTLTGNYIGFKWMFESGLKNGGKVSWQGIRVLVTDINNNVYYLTQESGTTNSSGVYTPAFDDKGTYSEVNNGYNYVFPLAGLYTTVYVPFDEMLNGSQALEAGTTIKSITLRTDSRVNQRDYIKFHLFEFVEGTITPQSVDTPDLWIGDVHVLHTFDIKPDPYKLTNRKVILDITKNNISSIVSCNTTQPVISAISDVDYLKIQGYSFDIYAAWTNSYTVTGQKFTYTPIDALNGEGFLWQYGDFSQTYDSKANPYGSITLPVTSTDWTGALGVTLYVKNYQPYPCSFNFEFQEVESGGVERWNLNNDVYRKVYAYDINTGEEFAFFTLTYVNLPASFEGWIRIPFCEFKVPAWSAANPWSDQVLTLSKSHNSIYITSMFSKNDGVTMLFDNVGIYYHDFQVGKLFDRSELSIKECLALTSFKVGE